MPIWSKSYFERQMMYDYHEATSLYREIGLGLCDHLPFNFSSPGDFCLSILPLQLWIDWKAMQSETIKACANSVLECLKNLFSKCTASRGKPDEEQVMQSRCGLLNTYFKWWLDKSPIINSFFLSWRLSPWIPSFLGPHSSTGLVPSLSPFHQSPRSPTSAKAR